MNADNDHVMRADRPQDVRIIASIPGRFSLADRRDILGERRVYACRAINISPRVVALATAVNGEVGDRVIAQIDHLGKLEGLIIRVLEGGFVINIASTAEDREKLALKIAWLEKFKDHDKKDHRAEQRFAPENPYSRIMLSDGRTETCLVIDVSVSGAGISAETIPEVGTVLAVGKIVGRVVRHLEDGFAVQFIARQSSDEMEKRLLP